MPPLPPANGVVKWAFKHVNTVGATAYSHMFGQVTTPPATSAQLQALANATVTAYNANLNAFMHNSWKMSLVECIDLSASPVLPGVATNATSGSITGNPLTAETAVLINMTVGRRYRGGHPRMYWPWGGQTSLFDALHWSTTFTNPFGAAWSAFINALAGTTGGLPGIANWVNVSYYSHNALRPTPVLDTVLAWNINPIPGSQRRRMGR
jgi:hypothetical protein